MIRLLIDTSYIGAISYAFAPSLLVKIQNYLLRRQEANISVHASSNVCCTQSFDDVSDLIWWKDASHTGKPHRNAF